MITSVHIRVDSSRNLIESVVFAHDADPLYAGPPPSNEGRAADAAIESRRAFRLAKNEFVKVVRGDVLDSRILLGVQFQTNFGRRSPWYGGVNTSSTAASQPKSSKALILAETQERETSAASSRIVRFEHVASDPELIIVDYAMPPKNEIVTGPVPRTRKSKLRRLMLSSTSLFAKTTENILRGGTNSVAVRSLQTGVARKLLFTKNDEGESYLRLLLEKTPDATTSKQTSSAPTSKRGSNLGLSNVVAMVSRRFSQTTSEAKRGSETTNMSVLEDAVAIVSSGEEDDDEEEEDSDNTDPQHTKGVVLPSTILSVLVAKGEAFPATLLDLLSQPPLHGPATTSSTTKNALKFDENDDNAKLPLLRLMFARPPKGSTFASASLVERFFKSYGPKPKKKKSKSNETTTRPPPAPYYPPLASLLFSPDKARGLRSLLQLLTDDEALDDPRSPSLLRMMVTDDFPAGRPSILRIMVRGNPRYRGKSLVDELAEGEPNSVLRRLLSPRVVAATSSPENSSATTTVLPSIARVFLTDTPTGKPCLGKFAFGESNHSPPSLMRLMVLGEVAPTSSSASSLLRLLTIKKSGQSKSVLDLLSSGNPSILDIMLKGEESHRETSVAREILGTTFKIENGNVKLGNLLVRREAVERARHNDHRRVESIAEEEVVVGAGTTTTKKKGAVPAAPEDLRGGDLKSGMTIASLAMFGEEEIGFSFMRVLLLGEDVEGRQSALRLMLRGEEDGEVSPLRILFTGLHAGFVAAQTAISASSSSSSSSNRGGLSSTLSSQYAKMRETLGKVTAAIRDSIEESHNEGSTWRESFEKLAELAKTAVGETWGDQIGFLYTAFARVRSFGPQFAKVWKEQWMFVNSEIKASAGRVDEGNFWKTKHVLFLKLTEDVANQRFTSVVLQIPTILRALDADYANSAYIRRKISNMFLPKWMNWARIDGGHNDEGDELD